MPYVRKKYYEIVPKVMGDDSHFAADMIRTALYVCCFVCSAAFLPACTQNARSKAAPTAVQGTLALLDWNFAHDGPIRLSGEWEFYWQRLLPPEAFSHQDPPLRTGFIRVPGSWNGYEVAGQKISGYGYATYRLHIALGSPRERLALKFLDLATAFTVYVNGQQLLSVGTPGQSRQTTTPRFFPQVVDLQPATSDLDVVMQVANFHHRKGGAW